MPTETLSDRYDIENNPSIVCISSLQGFATAPESWLPRDLTIEAAYASNWARERALEIVRLRRSKSASARASDLVAQLKKRMAQPYQFDVFKPGSINYGIMTTYRQRWEPISYQAGDLAGTIPLAPNERREVSWRKVVSSESGRASNEMRSSTRSSSEKAVTRSESDITDKAWRKLSVKGNAEFEAEFSNAFKLGGGSEFAAEQISESTKIKKLMREATRESAQEYRDERKLEVSFTRSEEFEQAETREISNPNNELAVTYLFYELQRRFEVSQSLLDAAPVVMVALDMPPPHKIDEAWLLEHQDLVREMLLDRNLQPALDVISQDFAGQEFAAEIMEAQWKVQLAVVNRIKDQVGAHLDLRGEARAEIQAAAMRSMEAAERKSDAVQQDMMHLAGLPSWNDLKNLDGFINGGNPFQLLGEGLFGAASDMLTNNKPTDEMAQQVLEWSEADLARLERQLEAASNAFSIATEKYVAAVRRRLNRRIQIDQLIVHIRANILHYMQAIWSREHRDARYLRFYDLEAPWPEPDGEAQFVPDSGADLPFDFPVPPEVLGIPLRVGRIVLPPAQPGTPRKLHQVADLDTLLGFRGNYAVFPLRESNALTDFMLQDYQDTGFGVGDPDASLELPTSEQALALTKCLLSSGTLSDDDRDAVCAWANAVITLGIENEIEVVVPTGQLFIEALPGTHPLLEDYKLQHRATDLGKAQAELRLLELEAERRQRLLDSGELGDPDIDQSISISGDANALNVDV